MRLKCPHCGSPMLHRTTRRVTPMFFESFHICRNEQCLFIVKAAIELVGYSHQSMMPNPAITLPALPRCLPEKAVKT